jgi:DNA repair exonuclease SbcCD ATPase subunit
MQDSTNDLRTDIALIKKDISQIEKMMGKLDSSIDKFSSLSKSIAVQERIVENHEKRLNDIDEKITRHNKEEEEFRTKLQQQLSDIGSDNRNYIQEMKKSNSIERERRHKEIIDLIDTLRKDLKEKNNEQDNRLSKLENWKWWIMGVGVTVTTVVTLAWKSFFG